MIRRILPALVCIGLVPFDSGVHAQSEVPPAIQVEGEEIVTTSISEDAQRILDRAVESMGGRAAFESGTSSRSTCHIALGDLRTTLDLLTWKPDRFKVRHQIDGLGVMELGFDGTQGWRKDPPDGLVSEVGPAEAIDYAGRLDLQAMVRDPAKSYTTISTLPEEIFEDVPCSVLLMSSGDRNARAYFEKASDLLKGVELYTPKDRASNRRVIITEWSDAAKMMPLRWVKSFRVEQPRETLEVTYDYVSFNDVSESTFIPPAGLGEPRKDGDG